MVADAVVDVIIANIHNNGPMWSSAPTSKKVEVITSTFFLFNHFLRNQAHLHLTLFSRCKDIANFLIVKKITEIFSLFL